jgi:hypothetical protein
MATTALEDVLQTDPNIVQNVFQKESLARYDLNRIPPVKEKFQVFKSYFPNQSLSNDILPIESFNNNFKKFPGIHTNPAQKVHSGSERKNVILNEVMIALEKGLPLRETDLQNVVDTLEKAKPIAEHHIEATEVYDLLNKLYRWTCLPENSMSDFRRIFYHYISETFTEYQKPIVVSAFNRMLSKLGKRTGDQFDITDPHSTWSREKACQILLNMLEFQRAYIQSLLTPTKQQLYESIGRNLQANLEKRMSDLQAQIKEVKRRKLMVENLHSAFRLSLQEFGAYYEKGLVHLDMLIRRVWSESTNRILTIVAQQNDPVETSNRMLDEAKRQLNKRSEIAVLVYAAAIGHIAAQMIYENDPGLLELDPSKYAYSLMAPSATNTRFFPTLLDALVQYRAISMGKRFLNPKVMRVIAEVDGMHGIVTEEPTVSQTVPSLALSESTHPPDYVPRPVRTVTRNQSERLDLAYFKSLAASSLANT